MKRTHRQVVSVPRSACMAVAAVTIALLPAPLAAQAVCSAPHSAPTISQSGSIQTLPPWQGWLQATVFRQQTSEFFNPDGHEQALLANGEATTNSLFLTAAVGVARGVDLWAQLPVHRLRFQDATGVRSRTGLGDPRFAVRVSPAVFGFDDVPLALRGGVKLPGSRFPVDATLLPLTEGQHDWEVSLETGHAPADWPVYLVAWVGYRWRTENESIARKPGNERFAHLAVGGSAGAFSWEVGAEGLWGEPPRHLGLALESSRRKLILIQPTLGWQVGPGRLDVGGQMSVAGRNLATGTGLRVGYLLAWGAR